MKKSNLIICALAVAVLSVLSSCGRRDGVGKPQVVVSIMPVYDVACAIAGDSVDVVCLLPRGGNPETYEPTMSQYVDVEHSDAFMYVSNTGFEAAIADRLKENATGGLAIADLSSGVDLLYGTHGDCGHKHHHHSGCSHGDVDPHVWSSAKNMRVIARNVCDVLKKVDAPHADYYDNNLAVVLSEIDSLDAEMSRVLAPHRGKAFVVWHPSLSYFARDYGLEQISVGGQENKEASVARLRQKIDKANGREAAVMVVQLNYDDRQAQVVNEQIGARVVKVDLLNADWAQQLKTVAYAIASERND